MEDDRHEIKHRYRNYFGVYNRYSVPGTILLIWGIAIFGLGVFDMAWTVTYYNPNTCTPDVSNAYKCTGNHVFSLVGSSLWGGVTITILGVMALWVPHRYVDNSLGFQIFMTLSFVTMIGITPAITVLNAIEIAMNNNVFYIYASNTFVKILDQPKFGVVFTLALLGATAFLVSSLVLLVTCMCPAPKKLRYKYKRPFEGWHPHLPHLHLPHPHMPHFGNNHRHLNPQGRPMMFNPMNRWMPYGQVAPPAARPYGIAPVNPYASQFFGDPYRYYNAMNGGYARMPAIID